LLLASCKDKKEAAKSEASVESEMKKSSKLNFVSDEKNKKVDVMIDGDLFTSYVYDGQTPKPILYPIRTKSGKTVSFKGKR
jgi:hypothetical protein